jgi:hypothetical protein
MGIREYPDRFLMAYLALLSGHMPEYTITWTNLFFYEPLYAGSRSAYFDGRLARETARGRVRMFGGVTTLFHAGKLHKKDGRGEEKNHALAIVLKWREINEGLRSRLN